MYDRGRVGVLHLIPDTKTRVGKHTYTNCHLSGSVDLGVFLRQQLPVVKRTDKRLWSCVGVSGVKPVDGG